MEQLEKLSPEALEDFEKNRQKEIKDLESRSKPKYELVVTENFTVNEVIAESYETSIPGEMIIGGPSHSYSGGFTSRLRLKVTPDNQNILIDTLSFDGNSVVRSGDYISAQIPRCEKKEESIGFHFEPYNRNKVLYFDRDFNSEESAIEIALLSEDKKILRRDRAVDYQEFMKR